MNRLFLLLIFLSVVLLGGCNIDIQTSSIPVPTQLAGTWNGSMQDALGVMHVLTISFDRRGEITQHKIDGVETGRRGHVSGPSTSGTLFSLTMSDGVGGGILTDRNYTHAALMDRNFNIAALEKSASPYILFTDGDITQPFWRGNYLDLDGAFNYTGVGSALLEVALDRRFNGTESDGRLFSETTVLSVTDSAFGRFEGAYVNTDNPGDAGPLVMIMTPDKTHLASYNCSPNESAFPAGCRYYLYNR